MSSRRKTEEGKVIKSSGDDDISIVRKQLNASEQKYKELIDKLPTGITITTPDGHVIEANQELLTIYGYESKDEYLKTPVTELYCRSEERKNVIELLKKGAICNYEVQMKRKDGSPFWASLNSIIQTDESGRQQYLAVVRDIDQRKRAEEELAKYKNHLEELVKERTNELHQKTEIVQKQAEEILEISTPVMQIWEGVLVAPLIGILDSQRTEQFMEIILDRIVETHSSVVLIDITAVPVIDTQTAQHMIDTISAIRLLGAQVVLTGVRPPIAQTLVHLGVDLSGVTTRSSLSAGLSVALKILGVHTINNKSNSTKEA